MNIILQEKNYKFIHNKYVKNICGPIPSVTFTKDGRRNAYRTPLRRTKSPRPTYWAPPPSRMNSSSWYVPSNIQDELILVICTLSTFLARLFYKTIEVLSPPARRRLRCLRPGKLFRQKIMSSFISSLTHNLFIFAVLIHMVVPIDNQALINIYLYYFSYFFHVFGNVST